MDDSKFNRIFFHFFPSLFDIYTDRRIFTLDIFTFIDKIFIVIVIKLHFDRAQGRGDKQIPEAQVVFCQNPPHGVFSPILGNLASFRRA